MGRWGQGLDWLRGLCNHLVGWTLTLAQVRSLNVLVIDKDVDLERLHVDERLWAVIATQILVGRFLKSYKEWYFP